MMEHPHGAAEPLIRFAGSALIVGGALAALLNLVLTPLLPVGHGTAAVSASVPFAIRMPLAATAVALTVVGSIGLYLAQAHRVRLGAFAFLLAGLGGMMAFCAECVQFTLVRDLAFEAPEVLDRLSEADRLGRYTAGFMVAVATFAIGWLAVAAVTLRVGVLKRRGPLTLIAGLVLLPVLGALGPGVWGAVAGNLILGTGWILLGLDLRRSVEPE